MNKTARVVVCGILAAGLLAGCGKKEIDSTQPAITVDDETVSLGEASFFLRVQQAETQAMMDAYGFTNGSGFWSQTAEDESGKSVSYGDQLKNDVRDQLAQFLLLRRHAADYDLEMPDAVLDKAAEAAKSVFEANTDIFEEMGTTQEEIEDVMVLSAYPDLMRDAMTADVDLEVSDDEAAQSRVVYMRMRLKETDEDGNQIDASEETKAGYMESMKQLLADIQDAGEVDEDSIREMANAIDEENILVGSTSYGEGDMYLPEAVLEAAGTLQDGESYGEVIEADGFYYLIHMTAVLDREATDMKKESIAAERQQEAYNALVQEWMDASEISTGENWDSLTVTDSEVWTTLAQ